LVVHVTTNVETWTVDGPGTITGLVSALTNTNWILAETANDPTPDDEIIEGSGSTSVTLYVLPKADGLPYDRSATITIAGKLFKITQSKKPSSATLLR